MTGLLAPTSGTVRIDGLDVTTHSLQTRRLIGYVPEQISLYPELRVSEYLDFRGRIKGVAAKQRRDRINACLDACDLSDVRRRLLSQLSKGYRQRVALADALLAEPKVLILDEPTVGLDPHQIRQTRELVRRLGEKTTILLSTHILPEVEMLCHKVVIIHQGRIVAEDAPQNLSQRLSAARTQTIRVQIQGNSPAIEKQLRSLSGVLQVSAQGQEQGFHAFNCTTEGQDIRPAIYDLAVKHQWRLRELSANEASLEEAFISLTQQPEAP
jgi:ABC-2 type transport system ATP-binding protein